MARRTARKTEKRKKVLTSFLLDATMLAALKEAAAQQDRSLGQALRLAARQWLDAQGRKGGRR